MALPQAKPTTQAVAPAQGLPKEETQLQAMVKRFLRNKAAVISLIVLVLMYLVAICAPLLAKESLEFIDVPNKYLPPSWEHPMGTDQLGRDVLSRMIWGSRISLSVGLVTMVISVGIGTVVGAIAGYYGGSWLDIVLMRIAEAIDLIPLYFLLVTLVAVVKPSIWNVMIVIGVTSWPSMARIVRGQYLSLRQRDYTEASRALGATDSRLIFRHILPNAIAPITVSATLRIAGGILAESGLSFLGLGTQAPDTSWGQLLSFGRQFLRQAPWMSLWPGLAIMIVVMAFNFVGDGLRDAFDPKMKK